MSQFSFSHGKILGHRKEMTLSVMLMIIPGEDVGDKMFILMDSKVLP